MFDATKFSNCTITQNRQHTFRTLPILEALGLAETGHPRLNWAEPSSFFE